MTQRLHSKIEELKVILKEAGYFEEVNQRVERNRFNDLKDLLEKTVTNEKDIDKIIDNKYFQDIVSIGEIAIPFILDEIKKEDTILIYALNLITENKICNEYTNLKKARETWLNWIQENDNNLSGVDKKEFKLPATLTDENWQEILNGLREIMESNNSKDMYYVAKYLYYKYYQWK